MWTTAPGGSLQRCPLGLLAVAIAVLVGGCRKERRPSRPVSPPALREDAAPRPARPSQGPASALPVCSLGLRAAIASTLAAAPGEGSGSYEPPSAEARRMLKDALRAALGPAPGEAADFAARAGYRACQSGELLLLLPPRGHALVALRRGAARQALVSVPHPLFEPKTALEGRLAFERWRARALVVAGAHRCASSEASGCPGRTKVCGGGPRAFPRSDAGHAQDSQFQAAHEALAGLFSDLVVVSLHGMAEDGISLSDGSSGPVEANSLLGRAARALAAAFPGERVTACQAGAGVPLAERLCGRTNLQGRLVNGARPPCGPIPITTRGRFLHIEQSMAVRAGPARLVEALTDALPGRQEEPRPAPAE